MVIPVQKKSLHVLLHFLLLFAILDAIMTDIGLRLQWIQEANPVMNLIYNHSTALFYMIKIVLPLAAFFFIPVYLRSRVAMRLLIFAVMFYSCILLLHGYWLLVFSSVHS